MLDVDSIPQLFSMYRDRPHVRRRWSRCCSASRIAVVPLQLGARSLTFPRLAAAGFWTWFVGAVLVVDLDRLPTAARRRRLASSSACSSSVTIVLLLGLVAAAGSLATTILTTRAPGMNMRRVPLFAWSALVGALGLLLVLPVRRWAL